MDTVMGIRPNMLLINHEFNVQAFHDYYKWMFSHIHAFSVIILMVTYRGPSII